MNETLSPAELELAASLWPKSAFSSEQAWLEYAAKWMKKLPSLTKALNANK